MMTDLKEITEEQKASIKEEKAHIKKENPKVKRVYAFVVFGDTEAGEKETYVCYLSEPSFAAFSKFMALSKKDEVAAMRQLAKDCFLRGDRELVDDDSLFLYGLMSQMSDIIAPRQANLVNF